MNKPMHLYIDNSICKRPHKRRMTSPDSLKVNMVTTTTRRALQLLKCMKAFHVMIINMKKPSNKEEYLNIKLTSRPVWSIEMHKKHSKITPQSTLSTKDRIQRKVYLHEDKALMANEEDDSSVGDNSHKLSRQVTPIFPMSILSTVEKEKKITFYQTRTMTINETTMKDMKDIYNKGKYLPSKQELHVR